MRLPFASLTPCLKEPLGSRAYISQAVKCHLWTVIHPGPPSSMLSPHYAVGYHRYSKQVQGATKDPQSTRDVTARAVERQISLGQLNIMLPIFSRDNAEDSTRLPLANCCRNHPRFGGRRREIKGCIWLTTGPLDHSFSQSFDSHLDPPAACSLAGLYTDL